MKLIYTFIFLSISIFSSGQFYLSSGYSLSLLPQSELTFKAALAGYETGRVDFATLLDAQRQIRQARQSQIKAQAEAQLRLADIERILGEDL